MEVLVAAHVGFSWILSIADTCQWKEKGRIFTFPGKLSAVTTSACSYLKFPFPKYPDRPNSREWKQNSSCSLFRCISFLHVVHVVMGSVPTLAKTFQGGAIRQNILLLHRMACSRKEIQMAIQYRIVPFAATADMYSTHVGFSWILSIEAYLCSAQREDNAIRRTPGTLRKRPNKAKIRLRRVLTSPRKQKPTKSPNMPGRLPMIGKAMSKPKLTFAWNHATCAIPQITPETNEGRMSWHGIWLCFLLVTT